MPVKASHLVGEHRASNGQAAGKNDFERIALDLIRDRAKNCKPGARVVGARRKNDSGSAPRLFVSRLRVEG